LEIRQKEEVGPTMPRYAIHIGLPKTGTKYLQYAFAVLREQMLADGTNYPNDLWGASNQFSHHQLVQKIKRGDNEQLTATFRAYNAAPYTTVLLSCEGFVDLDKAAVERLQRLIGDNPVEIVLYCRRWSDWLPSAWREAVRQGADENFPEWILRMVLQGTNEQAINFGLILDRYANVFGKDSIRLFSYSNILDANGDILQDFLQHVLGRTYDLSAVKESMNESYSPPETELQRLFNLLNKSRGGTPRPFVKAIDQLCQQENLKPTFVMIFGEIGRAIRKLPLDDNASSLQPVFNEITGNYGSNVIPARSSRTELFVKKRTEIPFATTQYLMVDSVVEQINELFEMALRIA
jgi:hypothetical protein